MVLYRPVSIFNVSMPIKISGTAPRIQQTSKGNFLQMKSSESQGSQMGHHWMVNSTIGVRNSLGVQITGGELGAEKTEMMDGHTRITPATTARVTKGMLSGRRWQASAMMSPPAQNSAVMGKAQ